MTDRGGNGATAGGGGRIVDLETVDAWWRAANYLAVGQIYLLANPLLREPLTPEHIKPRLLGHWGTSPALSFVYAHLNRAIVERGTDLVYVCGPGHGGPAMVANTWLEGTYSELFPEVTRDYEGLGRLFRQFSFPGGIPSHAAPETPGSINEGGELGYSLMHAHGAAFDNPDLVVACVIGDGEAETGPLAASWHAPKFVDPRTDGAVLPILNLNGYKIASPTVLARIPEDELVSLMRGYGYEPILVTGGFDGENTFDAHRAMADAVDSALDSIRRIWREARDNGSTARPRWPMIVLRSPKGWTGPKVVDGTPVENTWRSHQVPLDGVKTKGEHLEQLESWLRSYRPDELFDAEGRPVDWLAASAPHGEKRMSASPHMNGGRLLEDLALPDFRAHAIDTEGTRTTMAETTKALGGWLADVIRANPRTFRLLGPDETASNRLQDVFEVTDRVWAAEIYDTDQQLGPSGRVIEVLSEHLVQGFLEGYLLTGRHGLLNSYEAFIQIVDSMFNQHAKWLESATEVPWRLPVASLNYLLSSHVWQQDHNGFSHQDPGFFNVVVNKQARLVRIYLPADANTLLTVADHCLRTRDLVNVIVAGKQPEPCWLSIDEAVEHAERGLSIWHWAGSERPNEWGKRDPDVVLACAGDVPTMETIAAAQLLRQTLPDLRVRVVNIVDLMRLQDVSAHPHGLTSDEFDAVFTDNRPVILNFHGYPSLIHQLTYRRTNHADLHVRGFSERGTTTTPFDMARMNDIDRYRIALDVLRRVPGLADDNEQLVAEWHARREDARAHAYLYGEDPEWVTGWQFEGGEAASDDTES